jgi:hypothetical protein
MDSRLEDFRKLSSERGMRITPTVLESKANLGIEDYRQESCIPMVSG